MASALEIIGQMIWVVIKEALGSIKTLSHLFQQLLEALLPVSMAGIGGFIVAGLILILVGYFLIKFFLKSSKVILVMFILLVIILFTLSALS